jgi:hypothetical protein
MEVAEILIFPIVQEDLRICTNLQASKELFIIISDPMNQ